MISSKVNSALEATEKYVDYYLPDEDEQEMLKMEEFGIEDDASDDSSLSDDSCAFLEFFFWRKLNVLYIFLVCFDQLNSLGLPIILSTPKCHHVLFFSSILKL